jgi:hypothetical protein
VKVGDLVKCVTVGDGALGVIIGCGRYTRRDLFTVVLLNNNATCCFQQQHLEVINESR